MAHGLGGPGESVRVLTIPPDQLVEVAQNALSVFFVRSKHSPRLVECTTAAAEIEDHGHSKPLSPLIGFLPSDYAAEGGA